MIKALVICGLIGTISLSLSTPTFARIGNQPEFMSVQDSRVLGGGGDAGISLSSDSLGGEFFAGQGGGGGGGMGVSFLVKKGCQECQSSGALYTCTVSVATTFKEDPFKTQQKLAAQNCCAAQGGRVLATKAGAC